MNTISKIREWKIKWTDRNISTSELIDVIADLATVVSVLEEKTNRLEQEVYELTHE